MSHSILIGTAHMAASRNLPHLAAAAALALAGCAALPDLGAAPAPRAAASVAAAQSFAGAAAAWPGDAWWTAYGDPQFSALVEEGLRNGPDIAAAAARFRAAAGYAQQVAGVEYPSVDVTGDAGWQKQSYNNGFPREFLPKGWQDRGQAALEAGFDLDLWGKNRAAIAAAEGEARAAEIETRQAALMLATAIGDAYADLARLYAVRDIQVRTLALRAATQKLVADRESNGLETRGSVRQSESTAATARANLAAADEAIALRRHQIAALVGAGPDRALGIGRPQLAALTAQGLPADATTALVARRPDVAAALIRTSAAAERITAARADFFPAVRLSALVGLQALGLDQLVDRGSTFGNVGPAISLPIFHGGAIGGQYRRARADYDAAVANYDRTVVTAYREVADAVTSRAMLARRLVETRAARAAAEQAYAIARQRYEGGLSTYLDVLTVEDRLLSARQAVAELEVRGFALDLMLIRALGGGVATAAAAPAQAAPAQDVSHG